jgi:hypothetical protein
MTTSGITPSTTTTTTSWPRKTTNSIHKSGRGPLCTSNHAPRQGSSCRHPSSSSTSSLLRCTSIMVAPIPFSINPHEIPSVEGSFNRSEPTFYLPPLLSSLHNASTTAATTESSSPRLPKGSVDPASLSLHKALHGFHPLSTDYAEVPYGHAFNWDDLKLDVELEREW